MVFYFTATGNSLYAAKKFSENPQSIPQVLKNRDLSFADSEIGIVCPVYSHLPPKIVLDFMARAKFQCDYFFMIMTYGKMRCNTERLTAEKVSSFGIKINYIKTILMADNYLPVFDMDEESAADKNVDAQLDEAVREVRERKCEIRVPQKEDEEIHEQLVKMNLAQPEFNSGAQITITGKCIGCGICTKVCPVGNFFIDGGKSFRKKTECEFCLACAQLCPVKAITLSMADKNPSARYLNPEITLGEIIRSNNQNNFLKEG